LGKRISISQTDEIKYMKKWLEDRGKPLSGGDGHMDMSDRSTGGPHVRSGAGGCYAASARAGA